MDEVESLFVVADEAHISSDEDVYEERHDKLTSYSVLHEKSLSLDKLYVLGLCLNDGNKLFASLSDRTSVAFDVETLIQITKFVGHSDTITGISVCPDNENTALTSSLDGTIKLWDVRLNRNLVCEFKDSTEGDVKLKPLTSFDVSPKKPLIVAGTEQYDGDAFLLFWDKRSTQLLGGYWESHEDDITQVCFHDSRPDCMATGSMDGLINIFDLSKECEEDSLMNCLNTESSVDKISWFVCDNGTDAVSCVTHMEDVQLWNLEDPSPYVTFARDRLAKCINRNRTDNCYVVDVLVSNESELYIIAGSLHQRGEYLKLMEVENKKLKPLGVFIDNKQVVRACCYSKPSSTFITGGESGFVTVWKSGLEVSESSLKIRTKTRNSSSSEKPY